jgi:hypothetical protein
MHYAWIGIAALCFPTLSIAQIIVDESLTAQEVVESILVGEGVEIFNLTFTGDLDQIGSFDNNNSNIIIENGMVMASGSCSNVIGPNDIGSSTTGGVILESTILIWIFYPPLPRTMRQFWNLISSHPVTR